MRGLMAVVALLLSACGTQASQPPPPLPQVDSWLAMAPGDAVALQGPGPDLVVVFVDETYDIDGVYASAVTSAWGDAYVTDYFTQDADGTVWWYGRKGEWRAGRHGELPRRVSRAGDRVTFGDMAFTVDAKQGLVAVQTPHGSYVRS